MTQPTGVSTDAAGDVYVADAPANIVRRIGHASGVITTVAGVPQVATPSTPNAGYGGDGGKALGAELNDPTGVAVDGRGNVYIADYANDRVREVVGSTHIIKTVAGDGTAGAAGDGGPATAAELNGPISVAVDHQGNLYIGDANNCVVREVAAATRTISTVVGDHICGFAGDGGPATSAELSGQTYLAVDGAGDLYLSDYHNNRVREVAAASHVITTVAGNGPDCGDTGNGGPATSAALCLPLGIALDAHRNLYIADSNNAVIRKVTPAGIISTVVGSGKYGDAGDGGPARAAKLSTTSGVAVDAARDLFVSAFDFDTQGFNNVREASAASGTISTLVGGTEPKYGGDAYAATEARTSCACGLAVDAAGDVYLSDYFSARVRQVNAATGVITTIAGNGKTGFGGDGGPAGAAELNSPEGLAVDKAGDVFVADLGNNRVREISAATGDITTVAGDGKAGSSGDGGRATLAELNQPTAVAVDGAGDLFIYDSINFGGPGGLGIGQHLDRRHRLAVRPGRRRSRRRRPPVRDEQRARKGDPLERHGHDDPRRRPGRPVRRARRVGRRLPLRADELHRPEGGPVHRDRVHHRGRRAQRIRRRRWAGDGGHALPADGGRGRSERGRLRGDLVGRPGPRDRGLRRRRRGQRRVSSRR